MLLKVTVWLLVGLFVWDSASCSIICPDGSQCADLETCCKSKDDYKCCPYPQAVCCSDNTHCCPSGFRCNLAALSCERENQMWMNIPLVKKKAAERPDSPLPTVSSLQKLQSNHVPDQKSSVVHCDNYWTCPDGTTCCRHPAGAWFCCPYSLGRCCLDGVHCCPYGYDCDLTYTHCVRNTLRYPFSSKQPMASVPASFISPSEDKADTEEMPMTALTEAGENPQNAEVVYCDSKFFCNPGSTCCKGPDGRWNCCPYPLAVCCADKRHCCQYGYTCDPSSLTCRRGYSQVPSGSQERAKND